MEEIWKPVVGYEGLYEVSNLGRVKSLDYRRTGKERLMKMGKGGRNAYYKVHLYKDGKMNIKLVHRFVAEAFIHNQNNLPQVNHIDENGLNNRVDNLEWCTNKYNVNYGTARERMKEKRYKPVYQYSLDGKLIKEWTSTIEAQKQTGYACSNICNCCRGKLKQAYGYKWSYCLSL